MAEWELVLGAWLLIGIAPRLSWLAALLTFSTFAVVSGYIGWIGVASCGCLGPIPTSPWWAFGLHVALVGLLAVSHPGAKDESASPFIRASGVWAAGVATLVAGVVILGTVRYGSYSGLVAALRGESVTASTGFLDLGTGRPGEVLEAPITIRNWTPGKVRLIGGTSDCSCAVVADLPAEIEPGGGGEIRIHLHVPEDVRGVLSRVVVVLTDCPERPRVVFRIGCVVK